MALRAALRRAFPIATLVQTVLVILEKSGLHENFPAEPTGMSQVEEQTPILRERTAIPQLIHVLQTQTSPQETHPTVSMTNTPGVV